MSSIKLFTNMESHLLQMRGLKPMYRDTRQYGLEVASFTDAWIETCRNVRVFSQCRCRIFYRCVDWNSSTRYCSPRRFVASFTDAWIETNCILVFIASVNVASFTDAWIETTPAPTTRYVKSRIFYRCVDWNKHWKVVIYLFKSRIFYRCVDWNK